MAITQGRKTYKAKATLRPGRQPAKKASAAKKPAKRYKATPANMSDKEHLIALIRKTTGCTAKTGKDTLDSLIGTITMSLEKNKKFQLIGFGSFEVKKRPARKANRAGCTSRSPAASRRRPISAISMRAPPATMAGRRPIAW